MSIIELSAGSSAGNGSSEGHSDAGHAALAPARAAEPALSAVSWGAVLAGATAAAAISLVLLALGTGLGLAAISPWPRSGVQASTFGIASIVWVIVTQLCASALGGYLAGRLRVRWLQVPADEVYFRDTVHGLLTWALATLVVAGLLLSTASSAMGSATQAAATVAAGSVAATPGAATRPAQDSGGPLDYAVDYLLRRDLAAAAESGPADAPELQAAEVRRIFANAADATALPVQDAHYLGQLVARRTGLKLTDADGRVTQAFSTLQTRMANAKIAAAVAAESARKVAIQAALWLFIALLAGAFAASATALLGGRERDAG